MYEGDLHERLLLLSPAWRGWWINPFTSAQLSVEELVPLASFRLARMECAMPRDRAIVLDAIRREWESEADFEIFVRTKLPKVLAASKQRFSQQMLTVAARAFDTAFGGS